MREFAMATDQTEQGVGGGLARDAHAIRIAWCAPQASLQRTQLARCDGLFGKQEQACAARPPADRAPCTPYRERNPDYQTADRHSVVQDMQFSVRVICCSPSIYHKKTK